MEKVGLVLNPHAGNQKLAEIVDTIHSKLLEAFSEVKIFKTKKAGEGAEIVKEIAEEIDLLIGAGGDGTIYEIINALCPLENRPAFAIIPGGTCNDFSRTLGMNQDPLLAVEQIINKATQKVDVGKYDDQYFLNFWGIGLISEVSKNVESENKKLLGKMSYYIHASKMIFQNERFHLKVDSKAKSFDGEAVMMVIGNGSYLGGMQTFFPGAQIQDGKLDVLIIKQTSIQHFWTWLQSQIQNKFPEDSNEDLLFFRAESLEIEASPQQKIDCDGEIKYETPSKITVLPGHLTVVVGDFPKMTTLCS
ncbi:diacylglycerol/lipid kinase family protein [Cytobacillus horneckiae]|uniref:diacylglycerol/lipid kinase family protein n=1 Tax=Cytobacillus horneckiae TaxID=549687 RepID=UPI003D9A6F87